MVNKLSNLIKEMRNRTNLGILECKKALLENNENIELAIQFIKKSGTLNIEKNVNNLSNGIVLAKVKKEKKYGALIELNSETDFVAKNKQFQNFGKEIISIILKEKISDIDILRKFMKEKISYFSLTFKEKINIKRIKLFYGKNLFNYIHLKRIGVIVDIKNSTEDMSKKIAMHIAASNPKYISVKSIPNIIKENEKMIYIKSALKNGKTKEIAEKISNGKMKKFFEKIALEEQFFIFDDTKKIKNIINERNIYIKKFIRFEVGENFYPVI
ncbi:tsf [Wigglesworthia glossinidia endosymbiont of Glossina brevipalpis]|uniref:Elongation factor Ts n=1 Tax=Wigglesworthia glossinidia brevipalpis TaxID=36870 RepID=EFTS_WIGBR|nr:RecName: Full=Elongation factor Ts; Short=EF-Ts [Wigglesworthia glossinidia endosymbiont of Glossina brevipalpis]BAC24537.1 tsf [Wigglesworthia glossinidia endosymbiont of Glossina brevipalpis]